ncbi:hypothetical protein [uncultured Hyphomonas sp.]|uniref:hypothetical protein n=1 Tax=uncultured Hyphomonas sp. TaxID=225298 RepID=UPI002AAAEABF|nr:hypothetical protein [uncultured Hyphomonas sp.]
MKNAWIALACSLLLLPVSAASAQAPGLKRDYVVETKTVDWKQPRVINGFKFQVPADREASCEKGLFFLVERLNGKPFDLRSDPDLDKAMVQLGRAAEADCPALDRIYYSTGPGFNSVRRDQGWHLITIAQNLKRQYTEEQNRYYQTPLFPANGANPLADRGFYASRLVAQDGELSLYQAFTSEHDYRKNGMGVRLVLVHDISPSEGIAIQVKDAFSGRYTLGNGLTERINALIVQSGDKFVFSNGASMMHYVSCFHAPPPYPDNPPDVETAIMSAGYDVTPPTMDRPSQIRSLRGNPNFTSSGNVYTSPAWMDFFEGVDPMRLEDLYPGACQ